MDAQQPPGDDPPDPSNDARQRLTDLYRAHFDGVFSYAARRIGPDSAADLASEVFMIAWQRVDAIPESRERAWLFVTARNLVLDHRKRSRRRDEGERRHSLLTAPLLSHADFADQHAHSDVVLRALDAMPEPDRELVLLIGCDGFKPAEAAAVIGCTPGATRVRWHRARTRFQRELSIADQDEARAHGLQAKQPLQINLREGAYLHDDVRHQRPAGSAAPAAPPMLALSPAGGPR